MRVRLQCPYSFTVVHCPLPAQLDLKMYAFTHSSLHTFYGQQPMEGLVSTPDNSVAHADTFSSAL